MNKNKARDGEVLRYELAELYVNKGAKRAAIPLLQKILAENPKNIRARVLYGVVLRDIGLYPQAEKQLVFALRIEKSEVSAHAALGILYDLTRKHGKALTHHMIAVKLAPANASYRNNLGFSYYVAGNNVKAIRQLEQALSMDPSLILAYNNLAFAYGRQKDFEKAKKTFRSVLSEASTYINMAIIHEEHGEHQRAAEYRAKAYDLDPELQPKGN